MTNPTQPMQKPNIINRYSKMMRLGFVKSITHAPKHSYTRMYCIHWCCANTYGGWSLLILHVCIHIDTLFVGVLCCAFNPKAVNVGHFISQRTFCCSAPLPPTTHSSHSFTLWKSTTSLVVNELWGNSLCVWSFTVCGPLHRFFHIL